MLPSLLSYTKRTMEDIIDMLVAKPTYLSEEILGDFDEETRLDFLEKYCGYTAGGKKQAHKLNIFLGYPQDNQNLDGAIVLTQGESLETRPSIGGVEGDYKELEGSMHVEKCSIQLTDTGFKFTTTYPANRIDFIREVSIPDEFITIEDQEVHVETQHVFSNGLFTDGVILHVIYEEKLPKELWGLSIGYTATEQINVSVLSMNYTTILCLSQVLKAVTILMRQTLENELLFTVNKVSMSPIAPIDSEIIPDKNPNITYTQDTVMECELSYAIDKNSTSDIEKVFLRGGLSKYANDKWE